MYLYITYVVIFVMFFFESFLLQASVGHQVWLETVANRRNSIENRSTVLPLLVSILDDRPWKISPCVRRPPRTNQSSIIDCPRSTDE